METNQAWGHELKVGDTLKVYFGRQHIVRLRPYTGSLAPIFDGGAQIVDFASGHAMTIENNGLYSVVCAEGR